MKVKSRGIYKDKRGRLRVVLNTTDTVINYVYLCCTNVYENIDGACIDIISPNHYACIDRVSYIYISDINKLELEEIEVLSIRDFRALTQAINMYFTGEITCYEEQFVYKDMINIINHKPVVVIPNRYVTKTDKQIKEEDHIKIDKALEETREIDEVIKFRFNGKEWVESDDDEINKYMYDILASDPPHDLDKILDNAIKYNIRFEIDLNTRSRTYGEYKFNLNTSVNPGDVIGEPSKPRRNSKDSARNKNLNLSFSFNQVLEISMMNSRQTADRYKMGLSEAYIVTKNAKRLMGAPKTDKIVNYNYTKLFNEGMSVQEVYNYYRCKVPMSRIKANWDLWDSNGYGFNNATVKEKWDKILNSGDVDILIDTYFSNSCNSFAKNEKCSYSLASDIMYKIYAILCKNPFVASGFGVISFDRDALHNYASDALNGSGIENKIISNLYEMTNALYETYTNTYDDHSIILIDDSLIPESIAHDTMLIDCYRSLLWNRYNRRSYITKDRVLSPLQIDALETRNTERIALLFMVKYGTVSSIVNSYRARKSKEEANINK